MAAFIANARVCNGIRNAGLRSAEILRVNARKRMCKYESLRFYAENNDKNIASSQSSPLNAAPAYRHKPSSRDKFVLVWTKKYPSKKDIPEFVTRETMDKANNKARIYTSLLMGALTIVACIAMVISGKRATKRGESVQQQNLDWHKEINTKK